MTSQAQIITLPNGQPVEEESSLRTQVNEILEKHREDVTSMLKKWILFWSDFGIRTLNLDDCPIMLSKADREFALKWLKSEGFKVSSPRILGRATIEIDSEN